MEVKKNPKKDLRSKSIIFFQAGLILVLLLVWRGLERKSFKREVIQQVVEEIVEEIEEEIPITKVVFRRPPPPPPPPPSMEIVEVVEDDEPEPETVFEETDVEEDEEIPEEVPDFSDVEDGEGEEEEIGDVPFHVIEESAIFPGCEKERSPQARKDCFSKKLDKIITRKFNTDIAEELGLSGVQRIYLTFKVDKSGKVTDIRAKARHPKLQQEAIRVANLLPKMTPGKQRKKPVSMTFTKPITFRVE